jgi:hypothetical protein
MLHKTTGDLTFGSNNADPPETGCANFEPNSNVFFDPWEKTGHSRLPEPENAQLPPWQYKPHARSLAYVLIGLAFVAYSLLVWWWKS